MLLVTDLDGTYLHAPSANAQNAYMQIANHSDLSVVWATGRSFESVRPLLFDPTLPLPDAVICDVGACAYLRPIDGGVRSFRSLATLEQEMSERWPGHDEVLFRLRSFSGLQVQNVPQRHRLSFFLDEEMAALSGKEKEDILQDMNAKVTPLGLSVSLSKGRYVDVLVEGVSKYSTLQKICAAQGQPRAGQMPSTTFNLDNVICAGDTENDFSMLSRCAKGIVVGNADPNLLQKLGDAPHLHFAKKEGVLGVVEGLEFFGLDFKDSKVDVGSADLAIVYHRGPDEGVVKEDGKQSPNGILPSLKGAFDNVKNGAWVCCAREDAGASVAAIVAESVKSADCTVRSDGLDLRQVALSVEEDAAFYQRFSKEALWPILFSQTLGAAFSAEDYVHFVEVNRRFAVEAAATAAKGAKVWVHDYNLWLVPGFLRAIRPDLRIGFFLHTAFPGPDVFFSFPRADEVIASLLCCDAIGFHIPAYVESFARCASAHAGNDMEQLEVKASMPRFVNGMQGALGVASSTSLLSVREKKVRLGAFPVGIDIDGITRDVHSPNTRQRIEDRRQERGQLKYVLSVERLDYVKAPVERVEAFAQLLEENEHLRERVTLVSVCPLPNAGMRAYDNVKESLERAIGGINARFQTLSWTPIITLFRSLPPSELYALYANSDVCFVCPKRDGLNLVAKEYVAVRQALSRPGTLVLSEFAGVYVQADGAIRTHPYDPSSLKESLAYALELEAGEVQARHTCLARSLLRDSVVDWRDSFLNALNES